MLQFNNFSRMLLTVVRSSLNNKAKNILELNENPSFSLSIRIIQKPHTLQFVFLGTMNVCQFAVMPSNIISLLVLL
jgi:hypothetical protein